MDLTFLKHCVMAALFFSEMAFATPFYKVGFSQLRVDTTRSIPMGGYATQAPLVAPARLNHLGIHDPLFASAVAIQDDSKRTVVLVSVDVVGLSGSQIDRIQSTIKSQTPIAANVLISSTHTHQSPDTMGLWGELPIKSGRDNAYIAMVEAQVAKATLNAIENLETTEIQYVTGHLANNFSQLPDVAKKDDAFVTLIFKRDAMFIGSLTQWSAHPTVISEKNNTLSSDWVGAYREMMRSQFGGQHFYINGVIGATYALPALPRPDVFPSGAKDLDCLEEYEAATGVGYRLFEEVGKAIMLPKPFAQSKVEFKNHEFLMPIENSFFSWAAAQKIIERTFERENFTQTRIATLQIGELLMGSVPGEIFPSGSQQIRKMLSSQPNVTNTAIIGLGNDWLGYLMSPTEYDSQEFRYHKSMSPTRQANTLILSEYTKLLGLVSK